MNNMKHFSFEDDWREAMITHGNQMINYASSTPQCMFDDAVFLATTAMARMTDLETSKTFEKAVRQIYEQLKVDFFNKKHGV